MDLLIDKKRKEKDLLSHASILIFKFLTYIQTKKKVSNIHSIITLTKKS